jgi:hypothetical protein
MLSRILQERKYALGVTSGRHHRDRGRSTSRRDKRSKRHRRSRSSSSSRSSRSSRSSSSGSSRSRSSSRSSSSRSRSSRDRGRGRGREDKKKKRNERPSSSDGTKEGVMRYRSEKEKQLMEMHKRRIEMDDRLKRWNGRHRRSTNSSPPPLRGRTPAYEPNVQPNSSNPMSRFDRKRTLNLNDSGLVRRYAAAVDDDDDFDTLDDHGTSYSRPIPPPPELLEAQALFPRRQDLIQMTTAVYAKEDKYLAEILSQLNSAMKTAGLRGQRYVLLRIPMYSSSFGSICYPVVICKLRKFLMSCDIEFSALVDPAEQLGLDTIATNKAILHRSSKHSSSSSNKSKKDTKQQLVADTYIVKW